MPDATMFVTKKINLLVVKLFGLALSLTHNLTHFNALKSHATYAIKPDKAVENTSAALLLRFVAVQCEQFVMLKKI